MKRFKTNLSSNDQWNLKSLKIAEHNKAQIFSREKKKQQKIETKGLEYLHKSFLFCTPEKKLFLSNNNKTTCPKKRVNDTNSC